MKAVIVLLAFCVFLADSATYFKVQKEIPGHRNQCYDENDNKFYNLTEKMSDVPDICSRVTCFARKDKNHLIITYATCGTIDVAQGCVAVEDHHKPYPDCCPKIVHCETSAEDQSPLHSYNY